MNQPRPWPIFFRKTSLLGLWVLPALCGFYMMWTHWVPVPYWDEWDTPAKELASYYRGTLRFADLFNQHNESRLFFPRLLYLPISIAGGWDVRYFMLLTFAWFCAGSVGLYQIVRRTSGPSRFAPFLFAAMSFVLFSPRHYENFLYGIMGETVTPAFTLIFAILINLSDRSLKTKTLANSALAFFSTYTFANGMLVWLLAFPVETKTAVPAADKRTRIFWRAVYIVMAAASVAGYFWSYQHPPLSPPLTSPIAQVPAFLRFVLVWFGSLFSVGAPAICGAVLLFLFGALMAAAIWQVRRTGVWRPHYPWLVLGCYSIISGCIVAVGRLAFPFSMAGDTRYTASSTFLYIAVLGLGFSVSAQAKPRPRTARIALAAAVVSLVVLLTFWAITFNKERRLLRRFVPAREHLLLVLRWSEAIPQNPEIALLSPYPVGEVVATIRTLAENDVLRPRLVSQRLASAVNQRPDTDGASAGNLDVASLKATDHLAFQGWARIPDADRAADCVVLGFETNDGVWHPFCVIETGQNRPDVARQFGSSALARAGFSGTVNATSLPPRSVTVRAWAIDLPNERAFPMVGAVTLQHSR